MILIDTDHVSVLTDSRHARHAHLVSRFEATDEPVAIPVVSVEEQLRGWLAQIHRLRSVHDQIWPYARLVQFLLFLCQREILQRDERAADEFDRLRLRRIRIGTQDLKIASMALSRRATLLSANLRDFQRVPGLRVEDWLH